MRELELAVDLAVDRVEREVAGADQPDARPLAASSKAASDVCVRKASSPTGTGASTSTTVKRAAFQASIRAGPAMMAASGTVTSSALFSSRIRRAGASMGKPCGSGTIFQVAGLDRHRQTFGGTLAAVCLGAEELSAQELERSRLEAAACHMLADPLPGSRSDRSAATRP